MNTDGFSRRGFLAGLGSLGAATVLGGCATSATGTGGGQAGGALSIQSNLAEPATKAAMQALVDGFNSRKGTQASVNAIPMETFRTQLPTQLSSQSPSDLYTWYAGGVARSYAAKGLLLDLSDIWKSFNGYTDAVKTLSSSADGKQIIVPVSYYWWGMFYRKSNFEKWGVQPPRTWDEFIALCETLKGKGIAPLGLGAGGTTPWMASGWFDYLNIRINGAPYHRELLAGKRKFTDPEVKKVFERWKTVLPYFDPNAAALATQDAVTSLLQGRNGMMLIGTFVANTAPKDQVADLDFFQFPIIDPSVPVAEEAPTDGFFASARAPHVDGAKEFLNYVATPEAQELFAKASPSMTLPINTAAKFTSSPLLDKGKKMLDGAKEITQFFNRDSSDALQPTADTALIKFLNQPDQVDTILTEWQAAAEKVWQA
jgi:multiple sugar transport system substrate-binding protein